MDHEHSTNESIEEHLSEHGVRPTAVRILVWKTLQKHHSVFTLNDVEEMLPTTDHSSIFRTLRTFCEHHLLHEVNDGSGFCKYCLCRCEDEQHLEHHIHFTCLHCGKTYCITSQPIPTVTLPVGFETEDIEYVIKGCCPNCQKQS